jgi:hypothetical protein
VGNVGAFDWCLRKAQITVARGEGHHLDAKVDQVRTKVAKYYEADLSRSAPSTHAFFGELGPAGLGPTQEAQW